MPPHAQSSAPESRHDVGAHFSAAAALDVSFVVPLFNCLALSQEMLASLRATIPASLRHEIILVDDGSTDGTRAWLATLSDPAIHVILNERNLGYAAANNRAIATARGRLLVLLNNDVVLLPGWLEPLLTAHRSLGARAGLVGNIQVNARTGIVDHVGVIIDLKGKPEHDRRPPSPASRWFAPVRRVPAVTAACMVLSAALWSELGGYDVTYVNGGEDVDLCFRARAAGRVNAVALRSVVGHYVSSSAGRKLRDEANSEQLARRWRHDFVRCAARGWCRDYFATMQQDPRRYDLKLIWRVWLHAIGLTRTPPPEPIAALNASLDLEFVRWAKLLQK